MYCLLININLVLKFNFWIIFTKPNNFFYQWIVLPKFVLCCAIVKILTTWKYISNGKSSLFFKNKYLYWQNIGIQSIQLWIQVHYIWNIKYAKIYKMIILWLMLLVFTRAFRPLYEHAPHNSSKQNGTLAGVDISLSETFFFSYSPYLIYCFCSNNLTTFPSPSSLKSSLLFQYYCI